MDQRHYPVLLEETIRNLNIKEDGIYVDGTFGMGGHSAQILKRLVNGRLIAIDKDNYAINNGKERFASYSDRLVLVHDDFGNVCEILESLCIEKVDGMIFDLGVSSPQLDDDFRGFSYMQDAPLDMRMDTDSRLSAYEIVNTWSAAELASVLWKYGEERYSRQIADAIASKRVSSPIETTLELVDIIKSALPSAALREKQHPAKRTFQAIRIAVNDELGSVQKMISAAPDKLKDGGRICVISFHSLEDRIVKQGIASRENGCTCPRDLPVCVCGFKQTLKSVTKKPIVPSERELIENPRSRSAKLRVAEKIGDT
ncbi:MAG: 16S rRNA (cytosine(1402)-N(4))-methyltransferase RsmH [Oscillospiraceae bacterium]|nr:16S rRNA (cytosine(1402)-N(4))-methyltransferase RsmH [Oscillospiraceae bacterium]